MTKQEREQVAELLRCCVDLTNFDRHSGLYMAYEELYGSDLVVLGQRHPHNRVWALAFDARVAVREWQDYEAQCLEAALRIEEGSYP